MATSIAEQIAVKVRTRLLAIDEDDGYETTVVGVERPKRVSTFRPRDYQIVLTQGNITPADQFSYPGSPPATAWSMPFTISAILIPSDASTSAIDTLKNQFWGDVVKAICTPVASWYNWDNLAVISRVGNVRQYASDDGGEAGFQCDLNIIFRTVENDPFTGR